MANPLRQYKQTQRAIRSLFEPFTAVHCPTCPEPCCRKPARVDELDVLLAETLGADLPRGNPAGDRAEAAEALITIGTMKHLDDACDYLRPAGCSFPADLRPLGCTTFVCKFMEREMSTRELRDIKRLARKLEEERAALLKAAGLGKRMEDGGKRIDEVSSARPARGWRAVLFDSWGTLLA